MVKTVNYENYTINLESDFDETVEGLHKDTEGNVYVLINGMNPNSGFYETRKEIVYKTPALIAREQEAAKRNAANKVTLERAVTEFLEENKGNDQIRFIGGNWFANDGKPDWYWLDVAFTEWARDYLTVESIKNTLKEKLTYLEGEAEREAARKAQKDAKLKAEADKYGATVEQYLARKGALRDLATIDDLESELAEITRRLEVVKARYAQEKVDAGDIWQNFPKLKQLR